MEKKRFSIIIPTYNSADVVTRAIESVKKQSFTDYEIIVIDDCSKDNTKEVLSKYTNINYVRNEENLKAGGSRNKGLELAKGEYIIFLDADDYLADENTLQKINEVIGEDKPDIIYLGFKIVGRIEEEWIPTPKNSTLSSRARDWTYENVWDVCWNLDFIKRNDIKFIEKRYFEDFVFYYKGIIKAKSYKIASFITHIYTMYKSDSITSSVNEQKLQDLYINVNSFLEELKTVECVNKPDIVYAIYRVVEYSTRLLKQYERELNLEKHVKIKEQLISEYSHILEKYRNMEFKPEGECGDTIWVCWWQGMEQAPYIVKKCIDSIKKHSGHRNVVIITQDNYSDYVQIPDYIIEKLNKGIISVTHFSDILRMNLLSVHGGLWMDATCFMVADLDEELSKGFFTIKLPYNKDETCVSLGKWCVFCIGGTKHNILFDYMKDFYNEYWQNNDKVIDYYLMDYAISIFYENVEAAKNMIDDIPENNINIHKLKELLNNEYDEDKYNELLKTNKIHKLAHEKSYIEYSENDKPTFYTKLMK